MTQIKQILSREDSISYKTFLTIGLVQFEDNQYKWLVVPDKNKGNFSTFPRKKFNSIKALKKFAISRY